MRILLLIPLLLLVACWERPRLISDCDNVGDRLALCGWQKPEDMEVLGDRQTLIVSEMEAHGSGKPGALALFDTGSGEKRRIDLGLAVKTPSEPWGSAECSAPDIHHFAPHGISLSERPDGRQQLLVINHGDRESIEFFEIEGRGLQSQLRWQGCVIPPEGSNLNDVVALPEGGFMASHMYPRGDTPVGELGWQEITALAGFNPGRIIHWDGQDFSELPNFKGDYPNGIQLSADGKSLFINLWAGSRVQKLDRFTGELLGEAEVKSPDNSEWDASGKLLIASHDLSLWDFVICLGAEQGACPAKFRIVRLDPETMQTEVVLTQQGAPMGAGTVAQQVGDRLYIGSFIGDRMMSVPYVAK